MRKIKYSYISNVPGLSLESGTYRLMVSRVAEGGDLSSVFTSIGIGIASVSVKFYSELVNSDSATILGSIQDREDIKEDILVIAKDLTYTMVDRMAIDLDQVLDAVNKTVSQLFPYIPIDSTGYFKPDSFRLYNLKQTETLEFNDSVVDDTIRILELSADNYKVEDGSIYIKGE